MTVQGWSQILLFFLAILAVTAPLGVFMYRVLEGQKHFLSRPLGWLERLVYRLGGVDGHEQSWRQYAAGLLVRWKLARPSTPPPASRPTPTGRATSEKRR